MSYLLVAQRGLTVPGWVKNALWRAAKATPSLDLPFAESKSLVDAITGRQLVTFARASSGTYTDSAGVLRTAVTNLLLRSEEFNNASWTVVAGAKTVTANSSVAPNGTLTADTITGDGTSGVAHYVDQSVTLSAVPYTFTVYAKAGTNNFIQVRASSALGNRYANFDVSTGTTGTSENITSSSIESVGNGWYRCSMIFTSTAATGTLAILLVTSNSALSGQTNSLNTSVILWGAQLEQSSTVGEYIPTTSTINSAPRFDHNPTTGESLGLLVEEQRTNLRLNSATYQPSSGGAPAAYTVDQVAPDGTTTGSRQTAATPRTFEDYTGIANALYTFSFYCRVTSGTAAFSIQLKNAASDTVITSDTSPVATTAWRRFTISGTTAGATPGARVELVGVVPGFVLWGAQLEAGATASSYIPTTTAAATRNADVAQITGTNFSSWYRQDEGTLYGEYIITAATSDGTLTSFDDGTANNRWQQRFTSTGQRYRLQSGGVSLVDDISTSAPLINATNKVAHTIRSGDQRHAGNGLLNANALIASPLPTVTQLQIATGPGAGNAGRITIRRLTFFPQRLPNSTLEAITR